MHNSVMLQEVLQGLDIKPSGIYVDATFGRGGHSAAILQQLGEQGRLIVVDRDAEAIAVAQQMAQQDSRIDVVHGAFSQLHHAIEQRDLVEKIDGVLLDLGVSSPQLDDAARGFSFLRDGPLDMRMDDQQGETAAHWLASASEVELARVFWEYGEERFSRKLARAIVHDRQTKPYTHTQAFAAMVARVLPSKDKKKHPATRVFQAIRIHINQELAEVDAVLEQARDVLADGGRMAVISFHSLEDRRTKQFMKRNSSHSHLPRHLPVPESMLYCPLTLVGKAQKPNILEVKENSRSRSAVLRVAQKVANNA